MYLGTRLLRMQLHNDIWACCMSPSKYVQEAVRICKENVARYLSKGYKFPRRAVNPFESGLCPELDASPILYQSLIGAMRCMIEIG